MEEVQQVAQRIMMTHQKWILDAPKTTLVFHMVDLDIYVYGFAQYMDIPMGSTW